MEIVFIIAILLSMTALALSIKAKHKSPGYVVTMVLVLVFNVMCILIIKAPTIKSARNFLFAYYLIYIWLYMGILWTITGISSAGRKRISLLIMGIMCLVITALAVYCFNAPRIISFSKKILLGRMWWIAEEFPGSFRLLSFNGYSVLCLAVIFFSMAVSFICLLRSHRIFRGKYVILISFQLLLAVMAVLELVFRLPVWIYTLVLDIVCLQMYYYVFIHSDNKLRSEVIMAFANEMSDGLILYNGMNDLIHVNDLIKNLIDADLLERLSDIKVLEEWVSHVEYVENIRTLPYKKGDEEIHFIVNRRILGTEDDTIGTVFIFHDTTNSINRIRLMEKVNSELERTSRMKSDFLANMSHELRTPMNAVIGMATLALREDVSPRLRDYLNQINSSGKNLLNIINDILDYSKIDAGKMEIIPVKYEPLSEVNDISTILQTRIGEKDLEFFFIVDPSLPRVLIGDNMRIRQILINLANNAVKFTAQGVIKVTLSCERLSQDEMKLTFHVVDTGQGIKEEDLDKLFVSFQQVDSKRNRNVEGTGLGLAISKSLCEAMGGEIGVSSEYGRGSDFWFSIPQKIADESCDLVVKDAENKFAFCLNEKNLMTEEFTKELSVLGVKSSIISRLEEYSPSGMSDFLFIEEVYYTDVIEAFLKAHPDVTVVVLTPFGSGFRSDMPNVRLMMRPQTTLAMVLTLNGADISSLNFAEDEDPSLHFTAPEARVLIVDDNTINLSIAVGLMEPLKIICEVAESGRDALNMVSQKEYDLILMDHMMPGMDGVECTRLIREQIPSADSTPIIALTANVVEGSREVFLEAGMLDVIAKPVDVKQLNKKLYTYLPDSKIILSAKENVADAAEDVSDMFDCLDCVTAVKGLGSAALFRKITEEYYRRGARTRDEIEQALSSGDMADYAIKTHALKSSSRQIGALFLGDLAEKLEIAGKASDMDAIEEYHTTAMDELGRILSELSKYFPDEPSDAELMPIGDDELADILERLSAACGELDMDAMEECADTLRGRAIPEERADAVNRLCEAVSSLDTEGCLEIINEIMDDMR